MKTRYKISIPKPCHENWLEMSPNEKGRFCQSCSKTVIDFTAMKTNDIQVFIHKNKGQRICGHIKQSQLDKINLQISDTVFDQTLSFHKLFLLALLLAMGTSILSCSDGKGQVKKIESVEIVEKVMDSNQIGVGKKIDSSNISNKKSKDSLTIEKPVSPVPIPDLLGDIEVVEGLMVVEEFNPNKPISWHLAEVKPNFVGAPKDLTNKEIKDYFNKRMSDFVIEHFNITQGDIGLKGRQRIHTKFTIDKDGSVKDILVRAPHPSFEKEAIRVIKLLPQFTPGSYDGNNVAITYNLPIIFNIED